MLPLVKEKSKLIERINSSKNKPNFIKRLEDPNRKFIINWENPEQIATHKMSWADDEVVYPNIQEIEGKLIDFSRPPYNEWAGYNSAIENKDTIKTKHADWFTKNYKKYYPNFK